MVTPGRLLTRHYNPPAHPPHLQTLRHIIEIPTIKQIFPPTNIPGCRKQQSIQRFHFHWLLLFILLQCEHSRNTVVVHHTGIPMSYRLTICRQFSTAHAAKHAYCIVVFKHVYHISDKSRRNNPRILMQIYFISGV